MKNFLKENWFKVSIIMIVLILGLVYLFIRLPVLKQEKLLANNIKCQQEGSQLYERESGELTSYTAYYRKSEFIFNKELNTCLYKGELVTGSIETFFIKDVYTNKELAMYYILPVNGGWRTNGDKVKYDILNNKYFSK